MIELIFMVRNVIQKGAARIMENVRPFSCIMSVALV